MWIVKGTFCGCNAIWGTYADKETAEEVARRVNGTVEPWANKQK